MSDLANLDTFRPWSTAHWLVFVATALLSAGLAAVRRRWRTTEPAGRTLDLALALVAALIWVAVQLLQWTREEFSAATALPLHVSDLTCLAVPLALTTRWRWARALVYYWGLALGSLAFVLPDLRDGPARLGFWLFWLTHVVITAGVVYDVAGRGYRPNWGDFARAAACAVAYAAAIVPFNAATGHGYGYLGPDQPGQPPVLAHFGPWPLRVLPVVSAGLAGMALLTLPWEWERSRRRKACRAA